MNYNAENYLVCGKDLYTKLNKKTMIVEDEVFYKASSTIIIDGRYCSTNTLLKDILSNNPQRVYDEKNTSNL